MSPKWVSSFGTTIDLASQGNLGRKLHHHAGGRVVLGQPRLQRRPLAEQSSGVDLAIEPRFLPKTRLGNVERRQIPPAGAFGLE